MMWYCRNSELDRVLCEYKYIWGLNSYLVRIKIDSKPDKLVTQNDWLNG